MGPLLSVDVEGASFRGAAMARWRCAIALLPRAEKDGTREGDTSAGEGARGRYVLSAAAEKKALRRRRYRAGCQAARAQLLKRLRERDIQMKSKRLSDVALQAPLREVMRRQRSGALLQLRDRCHDASCRMMRSHDVI